jgi:hypothetical protein
MMSMAITLGGSSAVCQGEWSVGRPGGRDHFCLMKLLPSAAQCFIKLDKGKQFIAPRLGEI